MVNVMSLEDCMKCVDFSGMNYKEIVKNYDNQAMGDNFAVVAPDDSVFCIFLPNYQYDDYYLSFDDERTGTTEIEEFESFRLLIGYLKEQIDNLV